MLIDNILFLKKHYPEIRANLLEFEEQIKDNSIKIVDSKSGKPTLEILLNNGSVYLHSKYDPEKEAERFIEQYKDSIQQYDHVFFYGIGLGYHIEAFMNQYPELSFTMYEPNAEILTNYLKLKKIETLPTKKLKTMHLEMNEQDRIGFLNSFISDMGDNTLLIALPSYERIYKDTYREFIVKFKEYIKDNRTSLHTNLAFEKRWTLNSVMNFSEILTSPSILSEPYKEKFKDKPVIIVSAGPSLNEELEKLRYIKDNKIAYIFSVGSANKTLIKNDIYPDAVCTYDPQGHNNKVFSDIIDKKLADIPIIFGSSVGHETLKDYRGPKLHMLTNQDFISQYYLKGSLSNENLIYDAPSIAIITLQLLLKLEVSSVILVGQNFAYKNNSFYAQGIEYDNRRNYLTEKEINRAIEVTDVAGNMVSTSESFLRMKQVMEQVIAHTNIDVINTTSGGATIKGTDYIPLEQVIRKILTFPVVEDSWYESEQQPFNLQRIKENQNVMEKQHIAFISIYDKLRGIISQLGSLVAKQNEEGLNKQLIRYDREVNKLLNNKYYQVFINPTVKVVLKITMDKVQAVRFETNIINKASVIEKYMDRLLKEVERSYHYIFPAYKELENRIENDYIKKSIN